MPNPSQAMRSMTSSVGCAADRAARPVRTLVMSRDPARVRLPASACRGWPAGTGPPILVKLPLPAKDAERAEQLAGRPVRVTTRPATGELPRPALDPFKVGRLGDAPGDASRRVGDRPEPEDTRPALGRALAGHPVHDPARRLDAASISTEECDDSAAEGAARRPERDRVEGSIPSLRRRQPAAEVPAEQDRVLGAGAGAGARARPHAGARVLARFVG